MILLRRIPNLLCILFFTLVSCSEEAETPEKITLPTSEESSEMNKTWIEEEHHLINQFVKRQQWDVKETGTGLRYVIYKNGNGKKAQPGMRAMISFEISLLDGTICYSTDKSGPVPFTIEHDFVESGLHEGILLMQVGDRAKLIIPSYLAHGLAGDLNKIPTLATVVYDIKLLGVSK